MASKYSAALKLTALLLVLSIAQVYVLADFGKSIKTIVSEGQPLTLETAMPPQAITARLTTRGNQSISVNGNSAKSGDTLLSGATVETGDGVGATINLGPLGSIDIAPNTKALIEFSAGQIKVTIISGCAIVRNKNGTYAQLYTDKGLAASNDAARKQAAVLDVCYPSGAPAPIVNQGAAAGAGAGSGGGGSVGGAAAGSAGPSFAKILAIGLPIIGGSTVLAVMVPCRRGRNPSPGTPRGRNDECR